MIVRTGRSGLAPMLALAAALASTPGAAAGPSGATRGRPTVVVTGTRIHLGDLVLGAEPAAAALDLGPSPAAGVSRLVTRADVAAALAGKQVASPAAVPDAVNVVRKARRLAPSEVDAIVRAALGARELGHGVTLASVRADRAFDVADGWTRVAVDVPRAPKKAGTFTTRVLASLFVGDDVVARLPVPVDLAVSSDGATFEVARGATVTLVVRRSFVEVRAPGFAGADADVGDPLPVQLRPSGRVVRARLVSKDEALALDGDR